MRSFIAAVLILALIFSCVIPLSFKIESVRSDILLHAEMLAPDDLSSYHVNEIIRIIGENRLLFELLLPKNIYESMIISAKKLQSFAKSNSADLFAAECEVFLYYAKQLTF